MFFFFIIFAIFCLSENVDNVANALEIEQAKKKMRTRRNRKNVDDDNNQRRVCFLINIFKFEKMSLMIILRNYFEQKTVFYFSHSAQYYLLLCAIATTSILRVALEVNTKTTLFVGSLNASPTE